MCNSRTVFLGSLIGSGSVDTFTTKVADISTVLDGTASMSATSPQHFGYSGALLADSPGGEEYDVPEYM
jgi:hypothetical protein